MFDVVTIGETMIRLSPEGYSRWEQAKTLQVHIGGSESNVAVGLARLGLRVSWLSRLTNNDFGRRIATEIAAQGVDTSRVVWTDGDRVGTYYYEQGSPPRNSRVIYDRAASAFTQYTSDELPDELFTSGGAKLLHVTGISLALGDKSRGMIHDAVTRARNAGWLISFDVNYRAKLWSPKEACEHCAGLFQEADLVFLPQRDAATIWGLPSGADVRDTLANLAKLRSGKLTITTMGSLGSAAQCNDEQCVEPVTPVQPVGRLGGGDAFCAGFLYGWLTFANVQAALKWGNASAALKYSIPGDLPLLHKSEVEALVSESSDPANFR